MRPALRLTWLAAFALLAAHLASAQQSEKIRPLFRAREVVTGKLTDDEIKRLSEVDQERLVRHRAAFSQIRFSRSILLNDCGNWCGSPQLRFERIMGQAAESMNASNGGRLAAFRADLCGNGVFGDFCNHWMPAGPAPLHLLAVVNRLDLARWVDGAWHGAEIRFVYGYEKAGLSKPPDMTMILEWRYNPLSWDRMKQLAAIWDKLNGPAFAGDVVTLLPSLGVGSPQFDLLRIRTNSSLNSAQGWHLMQWLLVPAGAWARSNLNDEVDPRCYFSSTGQCSELITFWNELESDPLLNRRSIPEASSMLREYKHYSALLAPMRQLPGKSTMRPRNILSLQQCSQCHFPETETEFMHVANKHPGATSAVLSKFLTGGDPNASYDQLSPSSASIKHVVNLNVMSGCASRSCPTVTVTRTFHDLGRRRLFLAAVLASGPVFNDEDRKFIEDYGVDFSH
jgi:hypothetical protein